MARVPIYQISIGGQDVSSAFDPVLLSVTTRASTQDTGHLDSADIELDDRNGQIETPKTGAPITIALGYRESGQIEVFTGFIQDLGSSGKVPSAGEDRQKGHLASQGSRGQGRILVITAYSGDTQHGAQTPMEMHQDGGTFSDWISKLGQMAGLQVKVDDALGQISRQYWSAGNESFLTAAARHMREMGGVMAMFGNTVTLTSRNSKMSVSGKELTGIRAVWGDNLISWSIQPVIGRPAFSQFGTRWYDMDGAKHVVESLAGSIPGVGTTLVEMFKHANQDNSNQNNTSNNAASDQDRGEADEVTIEGEPAAQCKASCGVSGIKPGVDGEYTISSVTHHLARQGGYITTLGLNKPEGVSDGRS